MDPKTSRYNVNKAFIVRRSQTDTELYEACRFVWLRDRPWFGKLRKEAYELQLASSWDIIRNALDLKEGAISVDYNHHRPGRYYIEVL